MRKTPQERVAEYKAKALEIERREARKLRAKSPQWMATRRAIRAIEDALLVMEGSKDEQDAELRGALDDARADLVSIQADQVSP